MKYGQEIIQLLSQGYTAAEVAKELGMNRRTLEGLLSGLRLVYEAKNTTHLVAIAMRKKIIK